MNKTPAVSEFKDIIYTNFEKNGRIFPWREDPRPWGVMVSEFMLQQTQTERVIPYWERWMKLWPTPRALAAVSLEDALREWNGLGYNRRGRFVIECARLISKKYQGKVPETPDLLLPLPGIGPYTAGAIACFGYNYPSVFIETNIRAAMIHFFFQEQDAVTDREIVPLLKEALDLKNPRRWYWALMEYGAALKKLTVNPGRRSAHYAKQSPFEGSFRQRRGRVVKALVFQGPSTVADLQKQTGIEPEELYKVLDVLGKDSMVAEKQGVYQITNP
jgi:A/G-specific adenine glycosylase